MMKKIDPCQGASRTSKSAPAPAIQLENLPYASASDLENGVAQPSDQSGKTSKSTSPPNSNDNFSEPASDTQQQQEDVNPDVPVAEGGYMRLARWMACCDDFFVIRKFSDLTAFVLLEVQDDLVQLERKVGELDLKRSEARVGGDSFRGEGCEELSRLIDGEVMPKLKGYCKSLLVFTIPVAASLPLPMPLHEAISFDLIAL
jgi:hypothetical protein